MPTDTETTQGLTATQAAALLKKHGPNTLPGDGTRSWLKIAADAVLPSATDVAVDEFLRTGESVPVPTEATGTLFSGTLMVQGHGVARVTATGAREAASIVLLGWPVILFPVHIVFFELVVDPACSMLFENEPSEDDLMRHPPRDVELPLFGGRTLAWALLQGTGLLVLLVGAHLWSSEHLGQPTARAFVFSALFAGNLALIFSNRSRSGKVRFNQVCAGAPCAPCRPAPPRARSRSSQRTLCRFWHPQCRGTHRRQAVSRLCQQC